MKELIEKIKKAKEVAEKQFEAASEDNFNVETAIKFNHQCINDIVSPWVDPEGYEDYTDEQAVAAYGLENVMWFIEEANK